jgi:hypothetical protein
MSQNRETFLKTIADFMTLLYHFIDFTLAPLASESLPLINLFMANLSRNHIEKQVFNIVDLSTM